MKNSDNSLRFEGARKIYESTEIPQSLNRRVNAAIDSASPKKRRIWLRSALSTAVACCAVLMIGVNTNQVFAQSLYEIPVLGSVAKVFTFREYNVENDFQHVTAEIPSISDTGNAELETRINTEIQTKIDAILKEADERSQADKKAFVATGGVEKDFIPVIVDVNYEVKRSDDSVLSFVINKTETQANAFMEQLFYNIDLKTGTDITLKDVLGDDYVNLCNESIKAQITERSKDSNNQYFDGSNGVDGFQSIKADQNFYINSKGNAVICFEKYEIAPGYMGLQEFEIPQP